ncbi:hypothetical protein [Alteromonas sp. H39]|uniref:hypothetical protein n=1 Tax=Alteromonas sp. H39 TaxID=3389876 RepID=UPI0039DF8B52
MASADTFAVVFNKLRPLLSAFAPHLQCTADTSDNYWLDTHHVMKNKKPLFFGAVQIKQRYVSYHLMPVYVFPALLDEISAPLKSRMQGKSCFQFSQIDEPLFTELQTLTEAGFLRYREAGYV